MSLKKSPPLPAYKRSMILDPVHPRDYLHLNLIYACEQCSYYCPRRGACAMGFKVEPHLKKNQDKLYERTGRLAICRFQEID